MEHAKRHASQPIYRGEKEKRGNILIEPFFFLLFFKKLCESSEKWIFHLNLSFFGGIRKNLARVMKYLFFMVWKLIMVRNGGYHWGGWFKWLENTLDHFHRFNSLAQLSNFLSFSSRICFSSQKYIIQFLEKNYPY